MVRFGGNEFINCSIPLAFAGRYFILEYNGEDTMISVCFEFDGKLIYEVFKNEPKQNKFSTVSKTPPGIVTVVDKDTDQFLYKVRPASETSVVFGKVKGPEMTAKIDDRNIRLIKEGEDEAFMTADNNLFVGTQVGILVSDEGIVMGAPIPDNLCKFFDF